MKKRAKREDIIKEWLTLYPIRQMEYETDDKNHIVILVPHPENWFTRKLMPKPKSAMRKIHLDEIGTFVWQHCTGEKNVREICDALAAEFGEKVPQTEERTVMFVQQMYKNEFIKVYTRTDTSRPKPEEQ